ncbi:LytTR family DNA-binding domain-containing protein [Flavilitoribacter nigricans]|nr:LytTR family DNA-binding domain-containing protein [Flavilitoribacter nigricans]
MQTNLEHSSFSGPNDRWIFRFVYPLMTFGAVHIGNDNPLLTLWSLPSYYTDLILAAFCTYGAGYYFRYLFQKLDRKYQWEEQARRRIAGHAVYGVLIPLLLILGIECLYLRLFLGIPPREFTVHYLEMPLVFGFLLIINLFYIILYYRQYNSRLQRALLREPGRVTSKADYLLVNRGARTLQLPLEEVAYFAKLDGITFLRTAGGEKFLYDLPLEQIRKRLDQDSFYQLNRQFIAGRKSIQAYAATDTRKLAIELHPRPEQAVFVSKARATHFVSWLQPDRKEELVS